MTSIPSSSPVLRQALVFAPYPGRWGVFCPPVSNPAACCVESQSPPMGSQSSPNQAKKTRARKGSSDSSRHPGKQGSGRWTPKEHQRFLEAMSLYGNTWPEVVKHVATRSAAQIRSHAQKHYSKLKRREAQKLTNGSVGKRPLFVVTHEYWNTGSLNCKVQCPCPEAGVKEEEKEKKRKGDSSEQAPAPTASFTAPFPMQAGNVGSLTFSNPRIPFMTQPLIPAFCSYQTACTMTFAGTPYPAFLIPKAKILTTDCRPNIIS